jgi:hypothetical protein
LPHNNKEFKKEGVMKRVPEMEDEEGLLGDYLIKPTSFYSNELMKR